MKIRSQLVGIAVLVVAGAAVAMFRSEMAVTIDAGQQGKMLSSQRREVQSNDEPFWRQARVPAVDWSLPDAPEIHVAVERKAPLDYRREMERLLTQEELQQANCVLAEWFEQDAAAARDWLAARESLAPYQMAMGLIAGYMATSGNVENALHWAEVMQPGEQREQAIFDVYVAGARQRLFTAEQLQSAPLPESQRQQLISGVPGD